MRRLLSSSSIRSSATVVGTSVASSTVASSLSARQDVYVAALRETLRRASREGIEIATLAQHLSQILGEDSDPRRFEFDRITDALLHVNDQHYVAKKERLMPCDWGVVIRKVRSRLPTEGVLLPAFTRYVSNECPYFDQTSFPGTTIGEWAQQRFASLLSVSPARSNPSEMVFRPVHTTNTNHSAEDAEDLKTVQEALVLLDRPHALPVFTSLAAILPLLPGPSDATQKAIYWHKKFLSSKALRNAFDVDADIILNLATARAAKLRKTHVMIDLTTVSFVELPPLLATHAQLLAGVVHNSSNDAELLVSTKAFQHDASSSSPPNIVPDVLGGESTVCTMDRFLDASDFIASEISLLSQTESDTTSTVGNSENQKSVVAVVVVCGDASFDAMVGMAKEMKQSVDSILVCSPLRGTRVGEEVT